MYILHTVLHTFSMVIMRRICQTIKTFVPCWSLPFFFTTYMFDWAVLLQGEIKHRSLLGVEGLRKSGPMTLTWKKPGPAINVNYLTSQRKLFCDWHIELNINQFFAGPLLQKTVPLNPGLQMPNCDFEPEPYQVEYFQQFSSCSNWRGAWKKPQVTSDKKPDSHPSKLPCIHLWITRRTWHVNQTSVLFGPYSMAGRPWTAMNMQNLR